MMLADFVEKLSKLCYDSISVNLGLVKTDNQKIIDLTLRVRRTHLFRHIYYFSNQNIANLE